MDFLRKQNGIRGGGNVIHCALRKLIGYKSCYTRHIRRQLGIHKVEAVGEE